MSDKSEVSFTFTLKELEEFKNTCVREELTIQALRIVEVMRSRDCDADMIQNDFIGEIGEYEKSIARREGIKVYD